MIVWKHCVQICRKGNAEKNKSIAFWKRALIPLQLMFCGDVDSPELDGRMATFCVPGGESPAARSLLPNVSVEDDA